MTTDQLIADAKARIVDMQAEAEDAVRLVGVFTELVATVESNTSCRGLDMATARDRMLAADRAVAELRLGLGVADDEGDDA